MRHSPILAALFIAGWLAEWFVLSSPPAIPPAIPRIPREAAQSAVREAASVQEARFAEPVPVPVATDGAQLEILVRAITGLGKDSQPVPDIAFEVVRLGPRSVERSEVFGPERGYETGERVAVGATDEAGSAHVVLPADVGVDERGSPNVLVRVIEPGYQQRTSRAYVPREGGLPRARLVPGRGATARGRVVDAHGEPVLAQVSAERWIEDERGRRLSHVAAASPLPDGRFELHFHEDRIGTVLIAEAPGAGTAANFGVDLRLADPPQTLELTVRGAGALRGRIEVLDGRLLGGVPLLVRLAELDAGPGESPELLASLRRTEGLGLVEVQLSTDAEGRFDLRGLRAEPYVVRAKLQDGGAYGYAALLTDRPIVASDADVVLRVAQPQLVVRLLDVEGAAWAGARARLDRDTVWFREKKRWRKEPHILVYPLAPSGARGDVSGESLAGRWVEDHVASFSVEPGASYLVAVQGEDFTAEPIATDIPPGATLTELEVRATPARGWGTVVSRVAKVPTDDRWAVYDVFLEDPLTGLRLCELESRRDEPDGLRAPSGRYRLVVEGVAVRDVCHGTLLSGRAHGRAEIEIDVLADTRIEVPIELRPGARIDLELAGEPDGGDREAIVRSEPWMLEPYNVERLPERVASATVVLLRPHRGFEPVFRSVESTTGSGAIAHLEPHWLLGRRDTSQVVSPGTWRVVARLPGGREVATDVALREGETTRVRLEFED